VRNREKGKERRMREKREAQPARGVAGGLSGWLKASGCSWWKHATEEEEEMGGERGEIY